MNLVKRALLDADVSLSVVQEFVSDVKDKAIGEEVVRGVNPGQKFIEVVNKELINIMGNENSPLNEVLIFLLQLFYPLPEDQPSK